MGCRSPRAVRSSGQSWPSWSQPPVGRSRWTRCYRRSTGRMRLRAAGRRLHTYVSNLRHALGDVIVRRGDAYLLDYTAATVDAVTFEDSYRAAVADGWTPTTSAARLRHALAMWRGHPYADVEAHGFLDGEITRLIELRLSAIEARIDADMRAGRHREVVAELDALTVEHPFREHLRALHMLALYRSGRQAEALRAFARTREVLVDDLGIDPSPELRELQRRILVQDRDLLLTVGPKVQQRAVLVADIDDCGWNDPAEREVAFVRRESELAAAADRDNGVKLAPKGTAGYAVFAEPIHAVQAARQVVERADPGRGRPGRSGDARRRAGRAAARPGCPPRGRRPSRPGLVVVHRSRRAHRQWRIRAGPRSRWGASTSSVSTPALHIYQLVGHGFMSEFPELLIDRLPPAVPGAVRALGARLRAALGRRHRRAR